jgi:hypothetical protein
MHKDLKKLLEYLLEDELEEQVAISTGGGGMVSTGAIAGFTAPLSGKFKPAGKRKKKSLEEINSYGSTIGYSEGLGSSLEEEEDDPSDPEGKNLKGPHQHKKNMPNVNVAVMWSGSSIPGTLPQATYKALEENNIPVAKKKLKIICDKPLNPKSYETIVDFIKFCNSILKIDNMPTMHLHMIKKPEMTTGMYNRSDNVMHILVGKRLIVDVLRTIAHELTHRRQDEVGLLDKHLANVDPMNEMGDIDTVYENEAYTLAGNIVKIFCRKYKKIPKDELYQLNENKKIV